MQKATQHDNAKRSRIILGLLESVERDGQKSQRRLATELDVALGLVNAYLKRCIKKGLVKVRHAPARRYAYYLTPRGFAEKSRLTIEYLTTSLIFFREAKADCVALFKIAKQRGYKRVVLAGRSDLTEIAAICAIEDGIDIVAIVDPNSEPSLLVGVPLLPSFEAIKEEYDGIIVTEVSDARGSCDRAIAEVGGDRVLVPSLLRINLGARGPEQ